jgi:hypothetical protein
MWSTCPLLRVLNHAFGTHAVTGSFILLLNDGARIYASTHLARVH